MCNVGVVKNGKKTGNVKHELIIENRDELKRGR